MEYEDIYELKPVYETDPGWWKLRWRPLWRKTFSVWFSRYSTGLGFRWYRDDARNGWGRSFKRLSFDVLTPFGSINFWIKWNYVVHRDGPSDASPRQPLVLPDAGRTE